MNLDIATPLEFDPDDYSGSDPSVRLHVETGLAHAGQRLDVVMAALVPEHSRSRLQAWVRAGHVRVDGRLAEDPKLRLHGGEMIDVDVQTLAPASANLPEAIPLSIVYEDASILVLNKPAGLVVHPGNGNWSGTVLNALLAHCPDAESLPRAGIVHRLDKETSGLMVVAKTLTAQTDLVRQLQARSVKRHYYAFALGSLQAQGLIDAPLGRHPVQRTKMAVVSGGREARTHFRVVERFAEACWIECVLETGRTHQIRVHLAHIDHPLLGDPVYAGRRKMPEPARHFTRQALHAHRLGLIHPESRQPLQWDAPMPDDMLALLDALRGAVAGAER